MKWFLNLFKKKQNCSNCKYCVHDKCVVFYWKYKQYLNPVCYEGELWDRRRK